MRRTPLSSDSDMQSNDELQADEITSLHAIYGDEFRECPPPKAWKSAVRLPEFTILIKHPDSPDISCSLLVKFPKTYPTLAAATCSVQPPMIGVSPATLSRLNSAVHVEAQKLKGQEAVFTIIDFVQEWLGTHVTPVVENPHSLAAQAQNRADEEERVKRETLAQQEAAETERVAQLATNLQLQIKADTDRRAAALAASAPQRRPRANTDTTEVPEALGGDTPIETFVEQINCGGVTFSGVKLFHPRKHILGTLYSAEPICDDVRTTLPLEVVVVVFEARYYASPAGKKKLQDLEPELHRLCTIKHPNLLELYAAKLSIRSDPGYGSTRLVLLCEQASPLNLGDVLDDVDGLREEKATDYMKQILGALQALHAAEIPHRGLVLEHIGLAPRDTSITPNANAFNGHGPSTAMSSSSKVVKLACAGWLVRILALHRSTAISPGLPPATSGPGTDDGVPEAWLTRACVDSPLVYTKARDMHGAGMVMMQMLLGRDVYRLYQDPRNALMLVTASAFIQNFALSLLLQTKRYAFTAAHALVELIEPTKRSASRSPALTITPALRAPLPHMPMPGAARTPMPTQLAHSPPESYFGAGITPNQHHFYAPAPAQVPTPPPLLPRGSVPHSRWREEWDQLEILGSGAFGSVKKARHRLDGRTYAVKQIRLRRVPIDEANGPATSYRDEKLWREVDTLSRLNHPRIVRYFGTWLEIGEADEKETREDVSGSTSGSGSESGSGTEDGYKARSEAGRSDDDTEDLKIFAPPWWQEEEDRTTEGTWREVGVASIMSRSTSQNTSASVSTTTSTNISRTTSYRGDQLYYDQDELGGLSQTGSARTSFASILFESADKDVNGSDEEDGGYGSGDSSDGGIVFEMDGVTNGDTASERSLTPSSPAILPLPLPKVSRTLYIQMEYAEQGTLKDRLALGPIDEAECWRLFIQIVDALVHIARQGILHRDIKLTNIFIDSKGDCKLGDFGLATSSLEPEQSEGQPKATTGQGLLTVPKLIGVELTLEVGTRLYIAPEVQRQKGRPKQQDHSKADLYSAGIVFFEMNYPFNTDSERIYVIEDIRKPEIIFPSGWPSARVRQRSIITWLLQHEPASRPTALELSQSDLMPARVEDENIKSALSMIAKPDSPHFNTVLQRLFCQPIVPARTFTYDAHRDVPEHSSLNGVVTEKLSEIFRLHGAVDVEPLLLLPITSEADRDKVTLLDKHGDPLVLPDNGILPLARLAARRDITRIKRFHIGDVYKPSSASGHPQVFKSAVYDVISPDLQMGPIAAAAEVIAVLDECLNAFPTLDQNCEIRISHAKIKQAVFGHISPILWLDIAEILQQPKSSASQKRAQMLAKGLLRSTLDEIEALTDSDTDLDALVSRIEKASPGLLPRVGPFLEEIKQTLQFVNILNVTTPVVIHPVLLSKDNYFKDGVCFEVIRRKKRTDIIASGGRYDSLVASLALQKGPGSPPVCAIGVQIAVDSIVRTLATYQSVSVKNLIRDHRSFGFWSPRRCDVYIVSFQPGFMQERLEVAALLWRHSISADMIYEYGLADLEQESHLDMCAREGILFTVYPRPRAARRDQFAFKVKSVLKGTEYELSRQELVPWLQQQITEQKRVDATTSGVSLASDPSQAISQSKELPTSSDVQLILPGDAKKQRKQTKQIFLDRAFETATQLKAAVHAGLQVLAVDVPPSVFDVLIKGADWVTEDETWKPIAANFPVGQAAYAQQVRDSAAKRKADGHAFILLLAVREERVGLIDLS